MKFDVIETQNDSNIRLIPTPTQQKIMDKLNNIILQQNSTNFDADDDDDDDVNY